jgi:hypothetical protein
MKSTKEIKQKYKEFKDLADSKDSEEYGALLDFLHQGEPTPVQRPAPVRPPQWGVGLKAAIINHSSIARTFTTYLALHDAIDQAWNSTKLKSPEHDFLKWLIQEVEDDWPNRPLHIPHLDLHSCFPRFTAATRFRCSDIVRYRRYAMHESIAVNRSRTIPAESPPPEAHVDVVGVNGASRHQIITWSEGIFSYRAGECLGFAVLAAGTLLSRQVRGTVAIKNNGLHSFVEVCLPDAEPIIIDLWLGAVGHGIFYTRDKYPFRKPEPDEIWSSNRKNT